MLIYLNNLINLCVNLRVKFDDKLIKIKEIVENLSGDKSDMKLDQN